MIPIAEIENLLGYLELDLENRELDNKSSWEETYRVVRWWLDGQNDAVPRLVNHIQEQCKKQHYLNAIAATIQLQSLLVRKFSDLQKRKHETE